MAVSVHLVIDGQTVPGGRRWIVVPVKGIGFAIQSDGLEQQTVVRSPLRLNHQMVPRVAHRIARYSTLHPVHIDVVPGVPLMTAGNPALVAPDERHSVEELIDIEFQGLGGFQVSAIEVDVVGEIAQRRHHVLIRQMFGEFHIPQNVGERHGAADIKLHGAATAHCRILNPLGSSPGS